MSKRSAHHHTLPRLHLRGFADDDEQLMQLDVLTGREGQVSVSNASVRKHFYTIITSDGTRSDAWEQALSEIESDVAPAIRRAIAMEVFDLTDGDRGLLAMWIALQYLRGPDARRQMSEIASFTIYCQVGMGGLAYLRHAMSLGLGRDVPLEHAAAVWDDITSATGPQVGASSDEHLAILNRTVEMAIDMVVSRSWGRVRFARQRLLLSDAPVLLMGDGGPLGNSGLDGADVLTVPLDRKTLLWLRLPTEQGPVRDREIHPSTARARAHNIAAVTGCERFVFRHPFDAVTVNEVVLPRGGVTRTVITGGEGFANRDRPLLDVLGQIGNHTDDDGHTLIADYSWPIPGYRPPEGLDLI